jgi:hypothetical protein
MTNEGGGGDYDGSYTFCEKLSNPSEGNDNLWRYIAGSETGTLPARARS